MKLNFVIYLCICTGVFVPNCVPEFYSGIICTGVYRVCLVWTVCALCNEDTEC